MPETRLVGVRLKDGPGVMMRVPVKTKPVKDVAWKCPPVPRKADAVAKKHGLSKEIGRWLFVYAHYGKEWLKTRKIGEIGRDRVLEKHGLIRSVTTSTIVTHWSDGSVTQAGYFGPGSRGETLLTEKGTAIYVEMREAIAEGAA